MWRTHGDEIYKLRFGWDLGVCWVSVRLEYDSLNPWNTINFQNSYFNGLSKCLSKKALQMSSPNWDLVGVCWESAGIPLEVRWESAGSPLGFHSESAGSPLGVRWESTGSPLGVCWVLAGSPLRVRWECLRSPLGFYEIWTLKAKTWLQIWTSNILSCSKSFH